MAAATRLAACIEMKSCRESRQSDTNATARQRPSKDIWPHGRKVARLKIGRAHHASMDAPLCQPTALQLPDTTLAEGSETCARENPTRSIFKPACLTDLQPTAARRPYPPVGCRSSHTQRYMNTLPCGLSASFTAAVSAPWCFAQFAPGQRQSSRRTLVFVRDHRLRATLNICQPSLKSRSVRDVSR